MLPKSKYPMLNRKARRNIKGYINGLNKVGGWPLATNFLLAGLFIRAGITPRVNEEGAQV